MYKISTYVSATIIGTLFLAACSAGGEAAQATATYTSTSPPPAATPTATPTATEEPTITLIPIPTEISTSVPERVFVPPLPIGAIADFSLNNDILGISGVVEIVSDTKMVISGFFSPLDLAPGVDIRLGINGDFTDAVALSLKDITGRNFDGSTVTLNLPPGTLTSGRYDSIAVFCYDTGELFDFAVFVFP